MKTATLHLHRNPCVRWSLRVLKLLFALAMLSWDFAKAQVASDAVVYYTAAQILQASKPAGPLQAVVSSDNLTADGSSWREVALPYTFARDAKPQIKNQSGASAMSTRWFRVQVPEGVASGDTTHFYAKRWQTAGQIAVYADGRLVYRSLGSPAWNLFRHPGLFVPLNQTAQQAPPKEILIRLDSLQGAGGGLSSFYVGSTRALLSQYTAREWLEYQLPFMSSAAMLVAGFFCLCVWVRRRSEPLYLLLAAYAVLQVLRRWHFHTDMQQLPVSDAWFGWITLNALAWQIMVIHGILLVLHKQPLVLLTRVLLGLTLLFSLVTLPLGLPIPALVLLRPSLQLMQIAAALTVVGVGLWLAIRSRSHDGILLSAANVLLVGFGIYDWAKTAQLINLEWFYLTPYGSTILLAVLLFITLRRYVGAMHEVEAVNTGLANTLAQREAELAKSYQSLRAAEHQQTLNDERKRLTQDMHDGMGSSLVTALRVVESGRMSDIELGDVLKGCIDDLKLTIDSLEPVEADLLLLLATLRFRLGPRLSAAGIALKWEVTDVPKLDWLDPRNALHILRILQEAFANILKHTRATEIRVTTAESDGGVQVCIEDNGQGFDIDKTPLSASGKGLHNQQRRAQAIDGTVSWVSEPAGTQFTLRLPLKRSFAPV
jgi:signal transduction histidine kinase